jgi:hypothetical protein
MRSALALVLLAAPLAACGGGNSVTSVSLAQAATKSSKVATMKTDLSLSMSAPGLPQSLSMTGSGALDNAQHRVAMSLDMSGFAAVAGGNLGDPSLWKGEEVGDFSGGRLVLYMKLPVLTRALPAAKPWLKIDLSRFGKRLGVNFSAVTQFTADPSQMLGWLRATSGKITKVGTEKVAGVETTHYHATVDLAKYPDVVPPAKRAAARRAIAQLTRLTGLQTYPADAWVGQDGLVRQLRLAFTERIQGRSLRLSTTLRFHDFNSPVTVTIPPASETTDVAKLGGGALG